MQSTKLTKNHGWAEFSARLGKQDEDWHLLGGVAPDGTFRLYSKDQKFKLEPGWTALFFGPVQAKAPAPGTDAAPPVAAPPDGAAPAT